MHHLNLLALLLLSSTPTHSSPRHPSNYELTSLGESLDHPDLFLDTTTSIDVSEAMRVFENVQMAFKSERAMLENHSSTHVQQFWSALSAIRKKEGSMKFLRQMMEEGSFLCASAINTNTSITTSTIASTTTACARPKYTRTNYGYGIVFFPEFQSTILHMYRMRRRPRNILVLGSNLGTEALYLSHIFGSNTTVVGIEILSTLVQFSKENAAKHGFNQQVEFHCMDALDVDARMLARSDLILIDNQVWDLTLSLEIVSMLRRKNKMKKGTIVIDFASATKREVKNAMLISSSEDFTLSTPLLSPFVMVEENFHVATSWLVKPGARMNAYVRR